MQNTKTDKNGKSSKVSVLERIEELEQGEGLATLMPDIQDTADLVARVTFGMMEENESDGENSLDKTVIISHEERYLNIMKDLQFGMYLLFIDYYVYFFTQLLLLQPLMI